MRVLCVTWDGAGNLPPMLGTARRLAAEGHRVRVLCHRRPQAWVEATGSAFVAYTRTADYDSLDPPVIGEEELAFMWERLFFSQAVADDVTAELERQRADVAMIDHMLAGGICSAERAGVPVVVLFHQPWSLYQRGPFAQLWRGASPLVAAIRETLGLPPVAEPQDLWSGRPSVVASVPELGLPLAAPSSVHHVGPIVEHPPGGSSGGTDLGDADAPLVVVSLSTSQMGQTPVLQAILDGLAALPVRVVATTGSAVSPAALETPANARAVSYAPHEELLPRASAVVTHAGHGTILAALAHGVPVVCVPMGRDQFLMAARAEELGVGRWLAPGFSAEALAEAVAAVLADDSAAGAARDLAVAIAGYGGAGAACAVVAAAARDTAAAR